MNRDNNSMFDQTTNYVFFFYAASQGLGFLLGYIKFFVLCDFFLCLGQGF